MTTEESTKPGKAEEYRDAIICVHLAMQFISGHDIPGLLRAIEYADAVGPIFDPSLWIQKNAAMSKDRELLRAALPLWKILEKENGEGR